MPATWTPNELHDVLTHATPIVRTFLYGLAVHGSGTTRELGVQHMVAAIADGYAKARGKEPLFTSAKDGTTGWRVYTIAPKYRDQVARFLKGLPEPEVASGEQTVDMRPPDQPAPSSTPMQPRPAPEPIVSTMPNPPKRRPGRPRKIDVAGKPVVVERKRKPGLPAKASSDSITLPFGAAPDLRFWMQLVAMANEAVRRGMMLRFVSDGRDVRIEVDLS